MAVKACFITLEGIEGCGKSTQLARLADWLEAAGQSCRRSREPGGTEIGEAVRRILLDPAHTHLTPLADLLLYNAARAQHLHQVVEPALAAGKHVLCDRYKDATRAYQGAAAGLPEALLETVHGLPGLQREADLTLILDLPVATALARARQREATGEDRFEEMDLAFHQRVREGYLALAQRWPLRLAVVDASGSEAEVHARLRQPVAALLGMPQS